MPLNHPPAGAITPWPPALLKICLGHGAGLDHILPDRPRDTVLEWLRGHPEPEMGSIHKHQTTICVSSHIWLILARKWLNVEVWAPQDYFPRVWGLGADLNQALVLGLSRQKAAPKGRGRMNSKPAPTRSPRSTSACQIATAGKDDLPLSNYIT